jgi:photosystem II stability/assembly factor-like uncharacterized protein
MRNKLLVLNISLIIVCNISYAQWDLIYSINDVCLYDIDFISPEHGFFAAGNVIGESNDFGVNWNLDTVSGFGLKTIEFINLDTGFICCSPGSGEDLLITFNGGETWSYPVLNQGVSIGDIDMVEGGHTIYTECLTSSTTIFVASNYYGDNLISTSIGSGLTCYNVNFVTKDIGFVTGDFTEEPFPTTIYKSIDGGFNWYTNESMYGPLFYISFPTSEVGYGIGYENRVWKTINAGESWEMLPYDFGGFDEYSPGLGLGVIYFSSVNIGYIYVNKDNLGVNEAFIYKTIDGGATWFKTSWDIANFDVNDIVCTSDDTCYVITCSDIYKTTNGGGVMSEIGDSEMPNQIVYLYPIPAANTIALNYLNADRIISITTFNGMGEQIELVFDGMNEVVIQTLPSGVYYTQVMSVGGMSTCIWIKL